MKYRIVSQKKKKEKEEKERENNHYFPKLTNKKEEEAQTAWNRSSTFVVSLLEFENCFFPSFLIRLVIHTQMNAKSIFEFEQIISLGCLVFTHPSCPSSTRAEF